MAFPTRAEMKASMLAGWKEYWPVFITLLFTYLGWLALCRDDGYFVQAVGAVGVIIFLPLFILKKNIWFYVAAFFWGGAEEIWPEGAQWVTAFMGFEKSNAWTTSTIIVPIQGAVASFVLALLLNLLRGHPCHPPARSARGGLFLSVVVSKARGYAIGRSPWRRCCKNVKEFI